MIELRGVSHRYVTEGRREMTTTLALDGVSLRIPRRQFVAIVGPSGSGKSTLLRVVAGLLASQEGAVEVAGARVSGPSADRAMVFQHAALYPWQTVAQNVRFGLELSRQATGADADRIVGEHLKLVGLSEFADHWPHQLSGGMQQRVALARALAVSPSTLLMDEPFGALDAITRRRMAAELLALWEREQRTVLFVTHSLDEALVLADRVVLLRDGRVVRDAEVGIPRPRDPDSVPEDPWFLELRRSLWEAL
ncbi:MAG: NitT/TauT family transport system ATP-binding protein [Solirubrobacteraceae bacterium]|nr:NitT/TauT family transport system ATP-binding protein [Solirubrobacteraceae bacterium]